MTSFNSISGHQSLFGVPLSKATNYVVAFGPNLPSILAARVVTDKLEELGFTRDKITFRWITEFPPPNLTEITPIGGLSDSCQLIVVDVPMAPDTPDRREWFRVNSRYVAFYGAHTEHDSYQIRKGLGSSYVFAWEARTWLQLLEDAFIGEGSIETFPAWMLQAANAVADPFRYPARELLPEAAIARGSYMWAHSNIWSDPLEIANLLFNAYLRAYLTHEDGEEELRLLKQLAATIAEGDKWAALWAANTKELGYSPALGTSAWMYEASATVGLPNEQLLLLYGAHLPKPRDIFVIVHEDGSTVVITNRKKINLAERFGVEGVAERIELPAAESYAEQMMLVREKLGISQPLTGKAKLLDDTAKAAKHWMQFKRINGVNDDAWRVEVPYDQHGKNILTVDEVYAAAYAKVNASLYAVVHSLGTGVGVTLISALDPDQFDLRNYFLGDAVTAQRVTFTGDSVEDTLGLIKDLLGRSGVRG